ncbi:MAG: hypothetical protein OWV35_03535 [Firmicutes bacterium]|nr:hypothetical protein [Bacillota bacterium]
MQRLATVVSALAMLIGLMAVTAGFRDLPLDERPAWMVLELALWPLLALAVMEGARLAAAGRRGARWRLDWWRLLVHGLPALGVAGAPAGWFTLHFGAGTALSLLDFPTAKVMAAMWLALALRAAVEVTP